MSNSKLENLITVIIPICLFQGYIIAFSYIYFKLNKYGIPYNYVKITTENLILISLMIIGIITYIYRIYYNSTQNKKSKLILEKTYDLILGVICMSGLFISVSILNFNMIIILQFAVTLILLILIKSKIINRFLNHHDFSYLKLILAACIIVTMQVLIIGISVNYTSEKYVEIIDSKNLMILGVYDDKFIVTNYIRNENSYTVNKGKYKLIDMQENSISKIKDIKIIINDD